jgi:hypothetical protein
MIYKTEDGKHFFDEGNYSKIPLDHVPTEYLDWVLENYLTTSNLKKLEAIRTILDYKIKRIRKALEEQEPKDGQEIPTKAAIRRR